MPVLLLIRHGENDYTRRGIMAGRLAGVHLNERGREQAQALAKALAGAPVVAIYSSPLARAVETAIPIATALHLTVKKDAGLLETDVGAWQGKSIRRLSRTKIWPLVQRIPSRMTLPAGESFLAAQDRVVAAMEAIFARHRGRDILAFVVHGDPIKLAIAHYIGLPLDYFQRIGCDTGSLSVLSIYPQGAQLRWLNRRPPFDLQFPPTK